MNSKTEGPGRRGGNEDSIGFKKGGVGELTKDQEFECCVSLKKKIQKKMMEQNHQNSERSYITQPGHHSHRR